MRLRPDQNQGHGGPRRQVLNQVLRGLPRGLEAVGADIHGLHGSGCVQQHDQRIACHRRRRNRRPRHGQHQTCQDQQLQQQQQVAAQPLPGGVGAAFEQQAGPKQSGWDLLLLPSHAEDIEQQDGDSQQTEEQRRGLDEAHWRGGLTVGAVEPGVDLGSITAARPPCASRSVRPSPSRWRC